MAAVFTRTLSREWRSGPVFRRLAGAIRRDLDFVEYNCAMRAVDQNWRCSISAERMCCFTHLPAMMADPGNAGHTIQSSQVVES